MIAQSIAVVMALGAIPLQLSASDLQIYQNPVAKNNPIIMLAIDNSMSMSAVDATYKGRSVSRLNALKNSLVDALNAKDLSGNYRIPDNVYIGVSVFTSTGEIGTTEDWLSYGENARSSKILLEAKQLTPAHRTDLINKINSIGAVGSTPTPLLLSETYAYLLGNRTFGANLKGIDLLPSSKYSNYSRGLSGASFAPADIRKADGSYRAPLNKLNNSDAQCSTQGVFFLTDGAPVGLRPKTVLPVMQNALADDSFTCEGSPLKDVYYNYGNAKGASGAATFNGEFKEMATQPYLFYEDDIGNAVSANQTTWQNRSSWACVGKMVQRLANQTQMTSDANQKRVYTSTVGFGPLFQKHPRETCRDYDNDGLYDHCTFDSNYTGSGNDISNSMNAQALKQLGNVIGKGDTYGTRQEIGGYTQATSGEDIQNALNTFLVAVSHGNFEAASFGTYVVPFDRLSTSSAYPYVFAPQFQPQVSTANSVLASTHQLWLGNLKKYSINAQAVMIDRAGKEVLDRSGAIRTNTQDFWNNTGIDDGLSAIQGGVFSRIVTPSPLAGVTATDKIKTRPLFTNATIATTGDQAKRLVGSENGQLTKLTTQNVLAATYIDSTKSGWRQNVYQPYLLSALGYRLDKNYLSSLPAGYIWNDLNKVKDLKVMQQMGGVVHSEPLLVTLEAKYNAGSGTILANTRNATHRKDYVVFGTMQGLLHVVDQETGEEAFSFLAHEMVQDPSRRDALLEQSNTLLSSAHPIYGMDGSWTSDVQYKIDQNNNKFIAAKANIYGGMRMGGRSYYALDMKNPNQPELLFHVDPSSGTIKSKSTSVSGTNQSDALKAMGYSWSKPTIAKIRFDGKVKTVMIVGGGYDMAYETDGYQPQSALTGQRANQGAGVYIFDAETGELLWNARYGNQSNQTSVDVKHAEMKYSVVSQIKAFDRNTDGLIDHLYFGDLGGQVWRVDLNNRLGTNTTAFGRVTRLADFSAYHQRFYEMPALTIHDLNGERFGAVSIASGNRSFPLNTSNIYDNRVYVLHDYDLAQPNLFQANFAKTQNLTEAHLTAWSNLSGTTVPHLMNRNKRGWFYVLQRTTSKNETANTGTVKALNGYIAIANSQSHSDLYVSLYNPNDASSQQPNQCTGGIKGASRTLKLCLPYGVCGDAGSTSNLQNKIVAEISDTKSDGISKLNSVPIVQNGKKKTTLLGGGYTNYITTKVLKAYNWFERQ